MPPLPQQQRLSFTLPHKKEAAILERVLDDMIKNAQQAVEQAYPDGLPPADKPLPPDQRYLRYMSLTLEQDKPLLALDDYVNKFKRGEAPAFVSSFWRAMVLFPDEFRAARTDFLNVSAQQHEA